MNKVIELISRLISFKKLAVWCVVLLLAWILPSLIIYLYSRPYRLHEDSKRQFTYGIVFGAGVYKNGQPTPYLQTRLDETVQLYKQGTIKKILVSGDNGSKHYNEPTAMARYLQSQGVAEQDITKDYAGFSTYDTCYRAKAIFGVTDDVVVVSHAYHLARAIQTCRAVGVFAYGSTASASVGKNYSVNYLIRETLSINKALVQEVIHAKPTVLGNPELIQ